ncbi:Low molecular weight protein tyrosine phosphatase [Enhygromyxa salina]|uniref:protein-tyrosine-phosphatase n=1 Tax=Enhygromyxa salina TaxID=215803 RepID=A0A0C2D303_9BACT|nr:low molecular weight protein-tyrosine-phosphatase [Enhygromyxa salina]KIG17626.1 Low molecular weight protein tyrosine phosphatase [Enhygromyxa salina]
MSDSAPPVQRPVGVLFVCYANMCRSPLAEGVFRQLAKDRGMLERLHIDSAGTDAVEGCDPHPRSREIAAAHGITLTGTGRQLVRDDLSRFDHVVVMDRRNYDKIARLAAPSAFGELEGFRARLRMLRAIADPKASGRALDVPDPIGCGPGQYAAAYELIAAGCSALLDEIQ